MKKILEIIIIFLLFINISNAETMPDEYKLKDIGTGKKKLDVNFLCTNENDDNDRVKYSYKKFSVLSENKTLLRLDYDLEENVFFDPIRPIVEYKNLKQQNLKKNEVFVDYVIWGPSEKEIWFERSVFVNPKNKKFPYLLFTEVYTLTKDEYSKFSDLIDYTMIIDEDFFSSKTFRKEYIKKLIQMNNEFHKIIKESFSEPKNPSLNRVMQPDDEKRVTRLSKMARMVGQPSISTYECIKK